MKPGTARMFPDFSASTTSDKMAIARVIMNTSRRDLAAAAAFTMVPRHVLGGAGYKPPSEKLNIAGVGVGGMGAVYLRNMESENITALCDVDHTLAAKTFDRYPNAVRYKDFRQMLEKEKGIDAVVIGTPDHTHAAIAMAAMSLGKHVYCAKPITRTLYEARLLAKTAREKKVATQMSVQSCASEAACSTAEWVLSGAIGKVREVHVWSDRPVWPQGLPRPSGNPPVPENIDWDLWLGPAPERPYHPAYHPFVWRGWYDFGTGAVGDMGCHTLHIIVRALRLGQPLGVQATTTCMIQSSLEEVDGEMRLRPKKVNCPETFPHSAIITWDFPARGALPPVRLTWYEGGLKPPRPVELPQDQQLKAAGILFIGDKGTVLSDFSGGATLLPAGKFKDTNPPPKKLPRTAGHYQEFIDACKGGKPANCNFEFGGLLAEITLLGTVAMRSGKYLAWDAAGLQFTNDAEANQFINPPRRSGWSL